MLGSQAGKLSPQDKKLFNILQLRIYDISQNVQILSKQLSTNQIKEIVAQTYNIFGQLKAIFERCEVGFLYNIVRKIQINSVHITSILTDKLEKIPIQGSISKNVSSKDIAKFISEKEIAIRKQIKQKTRVLMIPQLGGIHLYNEQYKRGLQYSQMNQSGQGELVVGKHKNRNLKWYKQQFLTSIMEEIDNKAEVQVEGVNDEIKNYILNYKENTKLANFISCEKELGQIIDFFKISQLSAISFLNKSPNNNEYTQDYINRLNDLEKQIKAKENDEKVGILQKMKAFIEKMKQKMLLIEKMYQVKNLKLIQYEKSLKKVTVSLGTQTFDNLQRKIKDLQGKLREQQQKYQILNQMRKTNSYQDEINNLIHQIQVKNNQNKKLEQANSEMDTELQTLKKFVRQNKDRLTIPIEMERRRVKTRNKIAKQVSSKKLTDMSNVSEHQQQIMGERKKRSYRNSDFRQIKAEKKTHRVQKFNTNLSSGYRSSIDGEQPNKQIERYKQRFEQMHHITNSVQQQVLGTQNIKVNTKQLVQQSLGQELRQSNFKVQHKKAGSVKRTTEQDSKVSFYISNDGNSSAGMKPLVMENKLENKFELERNEQDFVIKQRSMENSRSMLSIEGSRQDQDAQRSKRNERKYTLRQKIEPSSCSIKEIDYYESKKSSKSVSKKCIILKQKKDKNLISTAIKFTNFAINQQFSISLKENNNTNNQKKQAIKPRPSYPFDSNKTPVISGEDFKSGRIKNKSKKRIEAARQKQTNKNKGSHQVNGLQSVKSNKSYKEITSSQKYINKNEESLSKKRQISKDNNRLSLKKEYQKQAQRKKQGISIQKTKLRNVNAQVQLKTLNEKSEKRGSKLKSQITNNYKKIAESLEYLRNERLSCNSQQKWKTNVNNSVQQDNITIMNYILEDIQLQKLNVEQFQEMIKAVQLTQFQNSQPSLQVDNDTEIMKQNVVQRQVNEAVNQRKVTQKKQLTAKTSNAVSMHKQKKAFISNHLNTKKLLNFDSSFETNNQKNNDSQHIKDCFTLDKLSICKLQQIHQKYGKCKAQIGQNRLCQHLQKYISIIAKINVIVTSTKKSLKLPIQRIGQEQDSTDKDLKQKINKNSLKKHTQIYSKNKFYKSDQLTRNYIKSHLNTDQQSQDQKTRILPLINNTTSHYYKPKSKVVR